MQADDDVGKVAQATPLLVSKAVELFMQSLVDAAVHQAQQRGSRKVQAYHLKQAIQVTEAFDFLKDIVSKIPNPLNGGMEEDSKRAAGGGSNLIDGNSNNIVVNQGPSKARDHGQEYEEYEDNNGEEGYEEYY
ncbi:histone-fold-containing protein [Phakopsora pachyrhizi]|nr:histone-fold-containing protein [Phakopsora pachyrhizi]